MKFSATLPRSNDAEAQEIVSNLENDELDWRVWLGLSLTSLWLVFGFAYVTNTIGWTEVPKLAPETLGSFLEGAFAPLAFLWLVVGYFLQQKELQNNTEALQAQATEIQRSAEQAAIQSERMAATELYTRQEIFMKILEHVRAQLGTIAGLLYISSQSTLGGDGTVTPEEQSQLFAQSAGDPHLFARRLLEVNLQTETEDEVYDLFYGTNIRARHTNHFILTFNRLLEEASEIDPNYMLRNTMRASAHGFLFNIMTRMQARAPAELADAEATGVHIDM